MLRSVGKQSGNHGVSPERETEGYDEKDLQKREVFSYQSFRRQGFIRTLVNALWVFDSICYHRNRT